MAGLARFVGKWVEDSLGTALAYVSYIPGSRLVGQYIVRSHQNDPARTLFELLLLIFALRYFFASKQRYHKLAVTLTEAEVDDLVADWEPEPLADPLTEEEELIMDEIPALVGSNGPRVHIQGCERELLNLTSTDVYDFGHDSQMKADSVEMIRTHGVGSCGPSGFYGNELVHISAEHAISKFLGTERAILYAQGFATATSVIPCFAKRGDVLVVDSLVNMAIQRAVQLSRARVYWYKHNDVADLEAQLKKALSTYRKGPVPRRWIITEGLFEYTGQSPDLPKLVELKKHYKFRLIVDESWSLGILGKTGGGIAELYNVPRKDIDITVGSLATILGTTGGFCAGVAHMVEHQRIVSLAYTFSASCPPYLAKMTQDVLEKISTPEFTRGMLLPLRERAAVLYDMLAGCVKIQLISTREVPIITFRLNNEDEDLKPEQASRTIRDIVLGARERGVLISRLRRVEEFEVYPHLHAIRLFVPVGISLDELKQAGSAIISAIEEFAP